MKLSSTQIIGIFFPIFFGCVPEREVSLPEELVGMWTTSAPSYADRSFEFTKEMLIFKVKDEEIGIHKVTDIEKFGAGKETRYTVTYKSLGDKYKFSFFYDPTSDGMILLSNRKGVQWTREESGKGKPKT